MLQVKPRALSYEDYASLPAGGPRYQLIQGEMHMAPAPNSFHQQISINLLALLIPWVRRERLGRVFHAPFDVMLTEHDVYQPDIVFISRSREGIIEEDGVRGAPDLIIEILSPGTARLDRGPKLATYASAGVLELWLIEPQQKKIEIFALQEDAVRPAVVHEKDSVFNSRLLPGLELTGQAVFAE